eukprot:CAMPEP_0118951458 /NCGR_PEP_ID=MMETSP1169-20130426/53168_1 /TAXON_ID=36882 /ORGANISM="Pyramimonas obovata, Strain CCMP722" /LENGTH=287 /DNA_ID=CAMNT_0006898521 /DNA_START=320 /DNA_END=1180 /DNA_ORIENTATION=+
MTLLSAASPWVSIGVLVSTAAGSGVVLVPYAFDVLGAIWGFLVIGLFVLLQYFAQQALVRASERYSVTSYPELVLARFGPWAHKAVAVVVTFYLLGNCVVLLHLIGHSCGPLLESWFPGGHLSSPKLDIALFSVLVLFPLSLNRSLSGLWYMSALSVLCLTLLSGSMVVRAIHGGTPHVAPPAPSPAPPPFPPPPPDTDTDLPEPPAGAFSADFDDRQSDLDAGGAPPGLHVVEALAVLMIAFQCHIQIPLMYSELGPYPSFKFWRRRQMPWPVAVQAQLGGGHAVV